MPKPDLTETRGKSGDTRDQVPVPADPNGAACSAAHHRFARDALSGAVTHRHEGGDGEEQAKMPELCFLPGQPRCSAGT